MHPLQSKLSFGFKPFKGECIEGYFVGFEKCFSIFMAPGRLRIMEAVRSCQSDRSILDEETKRERNRKRKKVHL